MTKRRWTGEGYILAAGNTGRLLSNLRAETGIFVLANGVEPVPSVRTVVRMWAGA